MNSYPEDYDLDTSDGYIVEDGSTILLFLLIFLNLFVGCGLAKILGLM